MKSHQVYLVAVTALLALLAGSSLLEQSMAMPLARDVAPKDLIQDLDFSQPESFAQRFAKRQEKEPTATRNPTSAIPAPTSRPTTTEESRPTVEPRPPQATTNPPANRPTTTAAANPRPTTTTSRSNNNNNNHPSSSETNHPVGTATHSGAVPSSTPTNPDETDNTLPTGVSTKVLIGLGTVGGVIVFALGGLAFCRHRKKKNLATALLQQTAQFNNNNPYAKLSEPSTPVKESLPMTPTKPLGTFNVVTTYTPVLADEIEIRVGDSITILQEFDDGWCMGVNNSRGDIKGVFPRHCLEMPYNPAFDGGYGGPGGPFPPQPNFDGPNKRMSSIAGWGNGGPGPYQGGGGGAYPPQGYNGGGGGPGYYNGY